MNSIRKVKAVFVKQMLSYFKNPGMWVMPLVFLAIPFSNLVLASAVAFNRAQMVSQFVIMFIGISMIGTANAFIMEDRTTMNLRFMGMAGVRPWQYLIATCAAMLLVSGVVNFLFAMMIEHTGRDLQNFMLITMLGVTASMLLGLTLALSKLAPFTMLISLLLGIGPAFAEYNEVMAILLQFTYTMHVTDVIRDGYMYDIAENIHVVLANIGVILVAFVLLNTRTGLDGERIVREKRQKA